ncbi:hypothetical protein [Thermococcus sp.]|uniref:hypothetical protein n=1 Tax=Thermococcus sp. TaxID=35749 RepID=UPI0025EB802A|nr:hypothetical protein [Thermococcus sp.]
MFGVLAYDRYTGKFTNIPITATYPLEILSTGKYTIHETQNGPTYVEGNGYHFHNFGISHRLR